jgi:hypothetical protein
MEVTENCKENLVPENAWTELVLDREGLRASIAVGGSQE